MSFTAIRLTPRGDIEQATLDSYLEGPGTLDQWYSHSSRCERPTVETINPC